MNLGFELFESSSKSTGLLIFWRLNIDARICIATLDAVLARGMLSVALEFRVINWKTDLEFPPSTFLTRLWNTVASPSHSFCVSLCTAMEV